MNIHRGKASAIKRSGHLHLTIDALFAQDCHTRARSMDKRRNNSRGKIEGYGYRKPWPRRIVQERELLLRALGIVAQALNMEAGF